MGCTDGVSVGVTEGVAVRDAVGVASRIVGGAVVGFAWAILSLEIPPSVSSLFAVTGELSLRNLSEETKSSENESKQLSTGEKTARFALLNQAFWTRNR